MPKQNSIPPYEDLISNVDAEGFYQTPICMAMKAIHARFTGADWALWTYLQAVDPHGDRMKQLPPVSKIAETIGVSERQAQRSLNRLQETELLPTWVVLRNQARNSIESQIRDHLHIEVGGLIEVATPAGRIDLLTDTEVIEVKSVRDWKGALGQVLVYSGFYPQHQKRLHLFGTAKELKALADIEAAVISFGIKVTGEEVA